jgi:peptide deformylase
MSDYDFSQYKLITAPHKMLTTVVKPFTIKDIDYRQALFVHMLRIMQQKNGVGLAANQINLDAAVFIMKTEKTPVMIINPIIIESSGEKATNIEGCLSDPLLWLTVPRATTITVQFEQFDGSIVVTEELNGQLARIFQHEYDHLNGITFTDRVSPLRLQMAEKKRQKLRKRIHVW